jgi:hypothetical protein
MMRTIAGSAVSRVQPGIAVLLAVAGLTAGGVNAGALPDSAYTSPEGLPNLAIPRHVIAGGGGSSSGGNYTLSGTIAQPDADPLQPSTGGVYAIAGGFWPGNPPGTPATDALFASGFE